MPKYLVTYHGGDEMPASDEARQQMMSAFQSWVAEVGSAMVDPGAPLASSRTVTSDGETEAPVTDPVSGYTLLSAGSLDEAVGLVRSHPFIARGGALRVSEALDLRA